MVASIGIEAVTDVLPSPEALHAEPTRCGDEHSCWNKPKVRSTNEFEKEATTTRYLVYFSWAVVLLFAYFREFLRFVGLEELKAAVELESQRSFPLLYNDFAPMYARNVFMRIRDVLEYPITNAPGATVSIRDRESDDYNWTFKHPGTETTVINTGSYNYLGFAEPSGPCAEQAAAAIAREGLASGIPLHSGGKCATQHRLEHLVAEFLGTEDALCFAMGFATNAMNCPALADERSLIISDQLNHVSLILGARMSDATIKVFKHNDMKDLERVLRDAVVHGDRKRKQPYSKIILVVEGIFSMEGSICDLASIIELKKKYKAYLYLDEAHSIGAMGRTGRGVVEYWKADPRDIDILMGTFTKSFGSSGGYLAGSRKLISHLRAQSPTSFYSSPMSPPIAQQIIASMSIIMGKDGTNDGANRIERLARNTRYFRLRLKQLGFIVYGSDDSPVVPAMIYYVSACGIYGREMYKRKVGVVVVSFPATKMTESRVRFCLSAAHTKEMLDQVLNAVSEVGDMSWSKHSRRTHLYKGRVIEW